MCGILGISGDSEKGIKTAAETIRYRGPDTQGFFNDEHFSLGFNRLAIIDLDERANQPMLDAEKKYAIVFNGEIYNHLDLKRELEKEFRFATTSDTEVLLHGHIKYGTAFAKRLRGMYAYSMYDLTAKTITIVRDHAGIKPLYYFFDGTTFAFASEMKALVALVRDRGVTPEIDEDAIRLFWAFGYIPSPQTQYKNFFVLPRSSSLTFDLKTKKPSVEPYMIDVQPVATESELFDLIEKKIVEHLIADVPVGLFFSGGTDSSVLAAALKRRGHPLKAFSVRIAGRTGDEPYFRAISEHLKLETSVFDFTSKEFAAVYEEVMGKLDIPLADNSIFPTYFVAKKAAEHVKVVLSGDGGDELFFGYPRQEKLRRMRHALDAQLTVTDRALLALPRFRGKNRLTSELHASLHEPVSYYLREMSPARNFLTAEFLTPAKQFLARNAPDSLYFDRDMYLENMLLRKTDLATMFNSLEGRVPLLDPDIIAAAANFESALTAAELKPVLKRMLARDLPNDLVNRKKSGFGMDLKLFFSEKAVADDVHNALSYFKAHAIPTPTFPQAQELISRCPNAAFAAIALYRSLVNS